MTPAPVFKDVGQIQPAYSDTFCEWLRAHMIRNTSMSARRSDLRVKYERVKREAPKKADPIEWNGKLYRTKDELAKAARVSVSTINRRLRADGHLKNLPVDGTPIVKAKPVEVLGQKFGSISKFAWRVKRNRRVVQKWFENGEQQKIEDALRGAMK